MSNMLLVVVLIVVMATAFGQQSPGTSSTSSTNNNDLTKRAAVYINAMNVTSSMVATDPQNYPNANHHTNALLAKLMLSDESHLQTDIDDALKIANHIIDNNLADSSFGGLFGAPLLTGGLGKYLPKETVEKLSQLLYNVLPEDPTQPWCDISYSNIYLMHTANLITLGEALEGYGPKAQKAKEAGYYFWQRWLEYTSAAGFHEFDSPTYTGVQLSALYIISIYAGKETPRQDAVKILDFLWTGIAASWFTPGQMLSGPHSRDYDFLFGKGLLTSQLYLAQISDINDDSVYTCEYKDVHCEALVCPWNVYMPESAVYNCVGSGLQAAFVYHAMVNTRTNLYKMPEIALQLSRTTPKLVQKRWQEGSAGDYHLYVSEKFALGLISDDYNTNIHPNFLPYPPNAQDKILSVALSQQQGPKTQSNPLSVLSLAPDWRRDGVYGKQVWAPQGKPFHLRMRPTAALSSQVASGSIKAGSAAVSVLLLALDPTLQETSQAPPPPGTANHLAMNIVLPWMDSFSMQINGVAISSIPAPMSSASNFTIEAGHLPIISLQGNSASIVIRYFLVDSCGDEVPQSYSRVKGDAGDTGGLEYHSLRLETVMFDSRDNTQDVRTACADAGLLRLGVIIAAADAGTSTGAADIDVINDLRDMVTQAEPLVAQDGSSTAVDVTVGGVRFELARDMAGTSESANGAILYRRLNGQNVQAAAGHEGADIYVNGGKVTHFPKY